MTVVLGVDPGSRHTGFGVIRGKTVTPGTWPTALSPPRVRPPWSCACVKFMTD